MNDSPPVSDWQRQAEATQAQLTQLQALCDALAATRTEADVARVVETHMAQVLGAEQTGIALLSADGRELVLTAYSGIAAETIAQFARFPIEAELPVAQAVRERRPVWLPDRATLEQHYPGAFRGSAIRTQAMACAPMLIDAEVIGGIGFGFESARVIDVRFQSLVQTLAWQAASALERAWRLQRVAAHAAQAEQANRRLTLLSEVSDRLARAQPSEPELVDVLVRLVSEHFGDACVISLLDEAGALVPGTIHHPDPELRAACQRAFGQPLPPGTGISHQALASRTPVFMPSVDRVALAPRAGSPEQAAFIVERELCGVMTAPLHVGEVPIGVLGVSRYGAGRPSYVPADLELLVEIAGRAALALMNVRRARAERELVAQLQEANRTKDDFLAILGHELRNPLAPLVTALDLASLRDTPPDTRTLASMRRQVEHLQRLVDDLLDVARVARGKIMLERRSVEVADLITRAVEMAAPLLEAKGHRLLIERGLGTSTAVDGDPARLAQVFANLLTNAAKYTDPGGRIVVALSVDASDVVVSVRDDGIGMSPEILPRIFDMFVQAPQSTDRRVGGLGLGLALVKNLVQMHGGTVAAESGGPGQGSRFTVRLPRGAARPRPRTVPPPRPSQCARRVLIVDDNHDAVDLLAELIGEHGHKVQVAYSGPEALRLIEEAPPEVAVLDIGLPIMDGFELARELRARLPALHLIALTGYGQDSDRERARAAGFAQHFVKPVSPTSLLQAIDG